MKHHSAHFDLGAKVKCGNQHTEPGLDISDTGLPNGGAPRKAGRKKASHEMGYKRGSKHKTSY